MNNILRNQAYYDKDNKNIIDDVCFDGQSLQQFWDSLTDHFMLYGNMTVGELIEKVYSALGKSEPILTPIAYKYGWPDLKDFSVESVEDMEDTFMIKINRVHYL